MLLFFKKEVLASALLLTVLACAPVTGYAAKACGTVIVPPGVGSGVPGASVTSLNPLLIGSLYDGEAAAQLFHGLLFVNADHRIVFRRSLASGIVVSHHATHFTVTLRPWRWSDGVAVTANDVKYTFDLIKKLGPTYPAYGDGGIPGVVKSFTVLGPRRFRVVTTHSVNPVWFELSGLSQLTPYPEHVWGKYSINQMWRRQSDAGFFKVIDGPFRIVSYKMGRHIVFGPNPAYQGHKPGIHRFIMKFVHTSGAEIEGIKTGSLDMSNLPFSLWAAGHRLADARIVTLDSNFGFQFLQLNYKNPASSFFRDVKVRQAMADAIDQEAQIRLLYHGTSAFQYGPIPVIPPTFLSPLAKAGRYPVGYDPARARRLLDRAGWRVGPGGIRQKGGRTLAFIFLEPSGAVTLSLAYELVQQNLRAVGIDMKIRQVTFNQLLALANRPLAWQALGLGWSLGSYPSDGGQLRTGGSYNQAGYSDKKMDKLLDAVTTTPGMGALYKYQDYAAEQQPEIFQPNPGAVVLVNKSLRGVHKFLDGGAWAAQYLHLVGPHCGATIADNAAP